MVMDIYDFMAQEEESKKVDVSDSASLPCYTCEECGYKELKPGTVVKVWICQNGHEKRLCIDCLGDCDPYDSY